MALKIGNAFINEDDLIPVIVKASTEIDTFVKGYHVYKNIWKPNVNEELETEMEPDKYGKKPGKFAKTIFYFFRADQGAECKVGITGKKVNLGNEEGMQVPCKLKI